MTLPGAAASCECNHCREDDVDHLAAIARLGDNMDKNLVKAIVIQGYNSYITQSEDDDYTPYYSPSENVAPVSDAAITTPLADSFHKNGGTY